MNRRGAMGIAGAAALAAVAGRWGLGPHRSAAEPAEWELLGTHPYAAAQPTLRGRALATLAGWRQELYAGYGDYNANTGPMVVAAWSPASGEFVAKHTSQTEALYSYRVIGRQLYAPAIDPRGGPGAVEADYAVGPPWTDASPVGSQHAYDMATLTGDDLWLVGQQRTPSGADAVVWRTVDGRTWTDMRRVPGGRFYFAGVYRGRLYVQAWRFQGGAEPASHVFDGLAWAPGPSLLPGAARGWRPATVADRLVYKATETILGPGPLLAFDGAGVTVLLDAIEDFQATRTGLLALGTDGMVRATADLTTWTPVATAPAGSTCLGLLGPQLFVGTAQSQLFRLRWPLDGRGNGSPGSGR